jgi:oxygen-independent coproporphyrinogen-3 oxidase
MLIAMKKEIALQKNYLLPKCEETETLYFGGGTPSILSIDELAELLDTVKQHYTLTSDTEITIEVNPDDLNNDYLAGLRHLGFNRLSIGIQSFFDDDLQWMNRRHSTQEAIQSVKSARKQGFHNINIDLMYGLPSMTLARWKKNLNRALALDVPHLSAYHITVEPRSVFGKRQNRGESFSIPEDESAEQFYVLINILEKTGYEHYEISNFARKGQHSRHNTAYWRQKPYVGIGPSAHSFNGQSRQWNISNNSRYIAAMQNETEWFEREQLTTTEQYNDYILVSLRAIWGADIEHIRLHFGAAFVNEFLQQAIAYIQSGYMQENTGIFTLTRKGKIIADRIVSDLFCEV